jgi:hypothetical protein
MIQAYICHLRYWQIRYITDVVVGKKKKYHTIIVDYLIETTCLKWGDQEYSLTMTLPSRQFVFSAPCGILGRDERSGPGSMIGVTASTFVTDLGEVISED